MYNHNHVLADVIMDKFGAIILFLVYAPLVLTGTETAASHVLTLKFGSQLRIYAHVQPIKIGMEIPASPALQDKYGIAKL